VGLQKVSPTNHIKVSRQEALELEINIMNVTQITKYEEGFSHTPYLCSAGFVTIGYGTKLHKSKGLNPKDFPIRVSYRMAEEWLSSEIQTKERSLQASSRHTAYRNLSLDRKAVILTMAYQLGTRGVLNFTKMWTALHAGEYGRAADEMLDSRWAVQTRGRALRLAEVMSGEELSHVYQDRVGSW